MTGRLRHVSVEFFFVEGIGHGRAHDADFHQRRIRHTAFHIPRSGQSQDAGDVARPHRVGVQSQSFAGGAQAVGKVLPFVGCYFRLQRPVNVQSCCARCDHPRAGHTAGDTEIAQGSQRFGAGFVILFLAHVEVEP